MSRNSFSQGAKVYIANLEGHASLLTYRKTILNAVQQVDASVDAYEAERVRIEKLSTAMLASQRPVALSSERYDRGLTDLRLRVLVLEIVRLAFGAPGVR